MTILKTNVAVVIGLGIAAVVAIGLLDAIKVKDPHDPRFDPLRYRFTDYAEYQWSEPIRVMFPKGTDKSFIDRVLVDSAGAEMVQLSEHYFRYMKPVPWSNLNSYSVHALYDADNKLLALKTNRMLILNAQLLEEANARLYRDYHKQERGQP